MRKTCPRHFCQCGRKKKTFPVMEEEEEVSDVINRCAWKDQKSFSFFPSFWHQGFPDQQRTLDKLPGELRRRNFVTKHRRSIANRRQDVPNVRAQRVRVPTEPPFCMPPLLVGLSASSSSSIFPWLHWNCDKVKCVSPPSLPPPSSS